MHLQTHHLSLDTYEPGVQLHGPLALLLQIVSRLLSKSVGLEHRDVSPSQAADAHARERTADSSRRSASTAALHVAAASACAAAMLEALPPAATPSVRLALTSAVSAARCVRAITSAFSARDSHVLASAAQSAARLGQRAEEACVAWPARGCAPRRRSSSSHSPRRRCTSAADSAAPGACNGLLPPSALPASHAPHTTSSSTMARQGARCSNLGRHAPLLPRWWAIQPTGRVVAAVAAAGG